MWLLFHIDGFGWMVFYVVFVLFMILSEIELQILSFFKVFWPHKELGEFLIFIQRNARSTSLWKV